MMQWDGASSALMSWRIAARRRWKHGLCRAANTRRKFIGTDSWNFIVLMALLVSICLLNSLSTGKMDCIACGKRLINPFAVDPAAEKQHKATQKVVSVMRGYFVGVFKPETDKDPMPAGEHLPATRDGDFSRKRKASEKGSALSEKRRKLVVKFNDMSRKIRNTLDEFPTLLEEIADCNYLMRTESLTKLDPKLAQKFANRA